MFHTKIPIGKVVVRSQEEAVSYDKWSVPLELLVADDDEEEDNEFDCSSVEDDDDDDEDDSFEEDNVDEPE
ncbi:hypothetical protein P691DRAFT_768022 [Macrolepiota fuliginosa MF-IS2]|uniref:Uncharacterized protein n=1 Tax=Macrolepiota fuliginosa MF-IS2 TaxID=1400762 RepID=A0A9P5WYV0_9AGAR|nr:hypothetical protein P691DRAFT_768022 [Macrolepiota fuliginosa MF-IS2]